MRSDLNVAGSLAFGILSLFLPLLCQGQFLDFKEATKLPATVNSGSEESMPMLSPDGKTLYFTRIMHPSNIGGTYSGSDIWISQKDAATGTWGNASNKKEGLNTKANNTLVGLSRKGDILYLLNTWGIYFSKVAGEKLTKPELINIPDFHAEGFVGAFVSSDYDVIFISMKGADTKGEEDLYVSVRNEHGIWSSPKNLGATINTKGFEISPFLSADKKRLYFASNGHPGAGDADIFFSDRLYDSWDIWSAPRNLGDKVNSSGFDAYFFVYSDSLALFTSNRNGGMADIYGAKVTVDTKPMDAAKKYLDESETRELIGLASIDIKFDRNSTTLNAAQNELLFYVANKVITKPEIKLQLIINEDDAAPKRLEAVSEKLKILGISSYRIDLLGVKDKDKTSPDGVMKIVFFK